MNSLQDQKIANQLRELHHAAEGDEERWAARRAAQAGTVARPLSDPLIRLGDFYIPVSPEEGQFLYLLARSRRAETIVEFGASYGISTLYLAAAARDTGGHVTTTEVHPKKCAALRASFAKTAVEDVVTLLEGDALETLQSFDRPIDMLFLDGWKSLYLPVFKLLRPYLIEGTLIAADNISFEESKPYLDYINAQPTNFITRIIDDMALSCVI